MNLFWMLSNLLALAITPVPKVWATSSMTNVSNSLQPRDSQYTDSPRMPSFGIDWSPPPSCRDIHDSGYVKFRTAEAPNITFYTTTGGWLIFYGKQLKEAFQDAGFQLVKKELDNCGWETLGWVTKLGVRRGTFGYRPDDYNPRKDPTSSVKEPSEEVVEKIRTVLGNTYPYDIFLVVGITVGLPPLTLALCFIAISTRERRHRKRQRQRNAYAMAHYSRRDPEVPSVTK